MVLTYSTQPDLPKRVFRPIQHPNLSALDYLIIQQLSIKSICNLSLAHMALHGWQVGFLTIIIRASCAFYWTITRRNIFSLYSILLETAMSSSLSKNTTDVRLYLIITTKVWLKAYSAHIGHIGRMNNGGDYDKGWLVLGNCFDIYSPCR